MKVVIAIGALALGLLPALARVPDKGTDMPAPPTCFNVVAHEPLLVFEVLGTTLLGQVDDTLTVYNDGTCKLATAYADGFGQVRRVEISPREVFMLYQALDQAGAFMACDDTRQFMDVPLHTVTLMNGVQDAWGHSFSYWIGDGNYAVIDSVLENFLAEHFQQ